MNALAVAVKNIKFAAVVNLIIQQLRTRPIPDGFYIIKIKNELKRLISFLQE